MTFLEFSELIRIIFRLELLSSKRESPLWKRSNSFASAERAHLIQPNSNTCLNTRSKATERIVLSRESQLALNPRLARACVAKLM